MDKKQRKGDQNKQQPGRNGNKYGKNVTTSTMSEFALLKFNV